MSGPVLYTFRRCPYAMRARLALASTRASWLADIEVREVVLRDKPAALVEASPRATVPVLVLPDGAVLDESFEIMSWALRQADPDGWLREPAGLCEELVATNDGPFKKALDDYKYPNRAGGGQELKEASYREACGFLSDLEARLGDRTNLLGAAPRRADAALFPFVRQFAGVDAERFRRDFPRLDAWRGRWQAAPIFQGIMPKLPPWEPEAPSVSFTEAFPG